LLLDEQPARKAVTSSVLVPMAASFDFFKDDAPLSIVVVCNNIVSFMRALNNSICSVPELQNIQKVQETGTHREGEAEALEAYFPSFPKMIWNLFT
jgi:hypothetical protein